ncbi:MAG: tRNA (adenine(22)-N(1))-methyltransferase [Candidatus Coproplasma sp.]
MGRIEEICSYIDECESFADVGCDHGYCTLHALKSGKCKTAVISDLSAKSLSKAERLLEKYIAEGRCKSVCGDGLEGVDRECELVLIAGMGGMEIIKILTEGFIPRRFIFQPMKNAEELRGFLIESGCKITVDDIFCDGKYYFIIKGEKSGGTKEYGKEELAFGRDSLKNPVFKEFAEEEIKKLSAFKLTLALEEKINFIKKAASLQ